MRRCAVLLTVVALLLPACGGDGPVVVSDLEALTAYLVAVMEAESALAEAAPASFTATSTSQALDLARDQVAAAEDFLAIVTALDPPPEASADRQALIGLATDQIDLYERMIDAVEEQDVAAVTSLTREMLAFMARSADEAAGRQELVTAALAGHPDRPLNQYLTAIAGLWVPLNSDYQKFAAEAQRALLAGNISGALGPYEALSNRLGAFLPAWEAINPPAEAAPFHARYGEWAGQGVAIFDSLLPALRELDQGGLQDGFTDMIEWAAGVNEILVMRNDLTVAALLAP